jgi:hypothetical protein
VTLVYVGWSVAVNLGDRRAGMIDLAAHERITYHNYDLKQMD